MADRPSAERSVRERLATHLISEECYEALLSDDYDEFLSSRARQFISHLQTRFGVRVIEAPDAEADEEIDDTEADPLDT